LYFCSLCSVVLGYCGDSGFIGGEFHEALKDEGFLTVVFFHHLRVDDATRGHQRGVGLESSELCGSLTSLSFKFRGFCCVAVSHLVDFGLIGGELDEGLEIEHLLTGFLIGLDLDFGLVAVFGHDGRDEEGKEESRELHVERRMEVDEIIQKQSGPAERTENQRMQLQLTEGMKRRERRVKVLKEFKIYLFVQL
jgi:hypothetical protein